MSDVSISVAVPAFNQERWIAQALESILGQTRPPDEVIVVDDGSTDATARVAERFGGQVRIVRQENGGAASAYNRGFREAKGDYVAKCPADDVWEPNKLECQFEVLTSVPEVDVLFSRARTFGAFEVEIPQPPGTGVLERESFLRALYTANCVPAPTALVRRALHEKLGGFREDYAAGEDYDFWLRALAAEATFYYDPRVLVRLRIHGGNLSLQPRSVWQLNYSIHREHAKQIDDPRLVRKTLAHDLVMLGRARAGAKLYEEARNAFRASLRYRPTLIGALGLLAMTLFRARTFWTKPAKRGE